MSRGWGIVIFFFIFALSLLAKQNVNLYHSYELTASDYKIIRWNIPKDSLHYFDEYIEETVDKNGRVIELKFLKNGKFTKDRLCYLPDIVRFEYPSNNIIIVKEYNADGTKLEDEDCPYTDNYKTIYKLDNNKNLIKPKDFTYIGYYLKSFAKLNRVFPINDNFNFQDTEIYNKVEEEDALKCIIPSNPEKKITEIEFYKSYLDSFKFDDYLVNNKTNLLKGKLDLDYFKSLPKEIKENIVAEYNKAKSPNFAGKYLILSWGCGSPCQENVIIDYENGKIVHSFSSSLGIDFKKNSRLVIINPPSKDFYDKDYRTTVGEPSYFVFQN